MAEFRVRFVGDLGNLSAFNAAIRNSLSSNAAILERANSQVVSRAVGEQVRSSSAARGEGLFVRNATTEIDRLNNSFIQSGTVVRRYAQGFTTETRRVTDALSGLTYDKTFTRPVFGESFHSEFRKAIGNVEAYERAIARLAPVERQWAAIQGTATRRIADIDNVQSQLRAYAGLDPTKQTEAQRAAVFRNVNRLVPGILSGPSALEVVKGSGVSLDQTVRDIEERLKTQRVTIQRSLRDQLRALQNDPVIRQISEQAFYAATSPEGRLGRQTVDILNRYPSIRRDLEQKAGLGAPVGGTTPVPFTLPGTKTVNPQYGINAQARDFQINDVYRDMERNLTRVSGAIRGTDGVMTQFSYTIDKNNNVVNSWGRNLSGARGFLNQTTRDLTKVVEWTVATTVVFGALGTVLSSFSQINELNVNLQRFAITARLSNEELDGMFQGLSQVAYATATPISELVKAADDMALATRRANQSTEEWQASILELANAVGILTNISGIDTVRATELLVASMKQLNLQTSDLVPLLSQITAAAGGQSASITDIASALAVLAEAAEGALIPLTGQIAAVQVISQVTGKSADQTANAFKNLFGAINADSSVKKLDEFGIAVRDAEGNLRPFLDIYRDIADAINTGIIPEGRVNEVLRAISGGRTGRQADAAALVANIYRVFEVQDIAATASNEALIANAKILDTNQAKITQFQNAFNITVFEKFNEVVADLTATLAELGTIFASVFGAIPTQLITITVEILALTAAIKLLSKAGAAINLGGIFGGIRNNLIPARQIQGLVESSASYSANFGALPVTGPATAIARTPAIGIRSLALTPQQQTQYIANLASNTSAVRTLSDRIKEASVPSTRLRDARGRFTTSDTFDIRAATGLRQAPTSSPYISPFFPIRDPISAPFGDPDLASYYRNSPWQHRNQFGPIQYIRTPAPELTRNAVPNLRPTGSFEPGVNLSALEAARRSGILVKMDSETKSTLGRFLGVFQKGTGSILGSRVGRFGVGAAAGGAAAFAGGSELSGLASLAGTALLFTPAAPIGAGLIIGGTIIDHFNSQAEEAKTKALDLQTSLYNLTLQWKQDAAAVTAAQETYDIINRELNNTEEGTEKYISLQRQLAEATVELSLALDTQAGSTRNIIQSINELNQLSGGQNAALSSFAQGLVAQNLDQEQIRQLVGIVSEQILAASGQPVFRPTVTSFDPFDLNYGQPSTAGIPIRSFLGTEEVTPEQFTLDPALFQKFIGKGFEGFTSPESFPFTNPAAVSAFLAAAEQHRQTLAPAEQAEFINNVVNPFREAVAQFGLATSQVGLAIQGARADIESRTLLGLLTGQEAEDAQANLAAAEALQQRLNNPNIVTGPGGVDVDAANRTIAQLLANALPDTSPGSSPYGGPARDETVFDPELLKTASQQVLESLGVWGEFDTTLEQTTAQATILREVFGLTDEEIIKVIGSMGTLGTVAEENLKVALDATTEWANGMRNNVGQELLQLQAQMQGGEFKDNPALGEALQSQLESTLKAVNKVTKATKEYINVLGEDSPAAAQILLENLQALDIVGFQGVENSVHDVNTAFFNWMNTLNLTGPQIRNAVNIWIQYMQKAAAAAALAGQAIRLALVIPGAPGINYTGIPYGSTGPLYNVEETLQREMNKLLKQLKNIGAGGTGTAPIVGSPSGGGSSGPRRTTDTLYLSEEQSNVADPQALVRQAYRDALKLQSQIPGEEKRNRRNTVIVFDEMNRIFKARGVSEELLRRALDNLTDEMKKMTEKADVVRRIRVGAGDFSAIANVPVNSTTGVSVAGNNQINITFNLNGANLTPAQFERFADMIGAEIARRL